jgi:hypothetical protein
MTELPKLTKKQQEILKLLYRYRFLNRIQIQAFLKHKDPKTINLWLKDLRAKGYVEWIYSTHFAEKTKPAIYYLGLNGIRYLKKLETYAIDDLHKRYREATRSQTYIDRCVLLADCCIALEQKRTSSIHYYYETEAEYLDDTGYYNFLAEDELIHPNLCFSKEKYDESAKEDVTVDSYLLEIFDATLPRYRMKKRLENYIKYLDEEDYEWKEQTDTEKLPILLFVCPRTSDLIYAKRRMRGLIAETWEYDDEERPDVRFTTTEKLKQPGIFAKEIWEKA